MGSATGTVTNNSTGGGTVQIAGQLSQLGPFTASGPFQLNFTGLTYDLSGTTTLVAANGDKLFGTVSGAGTVNLATGQASGVNVVTITGGTGRFTGASGTLWEPYTVTGSAITITIQGQIGL
jgi:hypothetical protein